MSTEKCTMPKEQLETDCDMDQEDKPRRSSILKPQKPRNPLSVVDFSEANPDNTLNKATRRVSFASSNFVKPFAADPEKNTIWDNTYEEEVSHTDSTKSCEQVETTNTLNTTLLMASELHQSKEMTLCTPKPTSTQNKSIQGSVLAFIKKLSTHSVPASDMESVECGYKSQEVLPVLSNCVKVKNIASATSSSVSSAAEALHVVDKENVHPLLNDLTLVSWKCHETVENVTKYSIEDLDYTEPLNVNDKIVERSEKKLESGVTVCFDDNEDEMEFTTAFSVKIVENPGISSFPKSDSDFTALPSPIDEASSGEMELTGVIASTSVIEAKEAAELEKTNSRFEANMEGSSVSNYKLNKSESFVSDVKNDRKGAGISDKDETSDVAINPELEPSENVSQRPRFEINENIVTVDDASCVEMELSNAIVSTSDVEAKEEVKLEKTACWFEENMEWSSVSNYDLNKTEKLVSDVEKNKKSIVVINGGENSAVTINPEPESSRNASQIKFSETTNVVTRTSATVDLEENQISDAINHGAIKKLSKAKKRKHVRNSNSFNDSSSEQLDEKRVYTRETPEKIVDSETVPNNTNVNILYSQPFKIRDDSQRLSQIETPASSFHFNLSSMSSCVEDTQQFIHARFSNPETLKNFNRNKPGTSSNVPETNFDDNRPENEEVPTETSDTASNDGFSENKRTFTKETRHKTFAIDVIPDKADIEFMKITTETFKDTNRSCLLTDVTPLDLAMEDFGDSLHLSSSPEKEHAELEIYTDAVDRSTDSALNDSTLRSRYLLKTIDEFTTWYTPTEVILYDTTELEKQMKENCGLIRELLKRPNKHKIRDLEEYTKELMDDIASHDPVSDVSDEDPRFSALQELVVKKSLQERVCDKAKETIKYCRFVKLAEDGFYCFYTLFETLPFKVRTHPQLGTVQDVQTFINLSDFSEPLCWYEINYLRQKLVHENLLSTLGKNYDIFALLDYVYMLMDEISKYHLEFLSLEERYGKKYHIRMTQDHSIVFEILDVRHIVFWIITLKLSDKDLFVVAKENVTVVEKVGKPAKEEAVRTIVENTVKGPNFVRNVIENVEEFVDKTIRRIRK